MGNKILTKQNGKWSASDDTETKNGVINLATMAAMFDGSDSATWKNFNSYGTCAQEGMIKNVVAGRCIQYLSQAIASLEWVLKDSDGNPIQQHELLKLLKRPNPSQGTSTFFQSLMVHKLLSGSSYIRAIRPNEGKPPTELELLRPDRVMINQGNARLPLSYTYHDIDYSKTFEVNQLNGECDVLCIKYPHALLDHDGLSPTHQAGRAIALHNEYTEYNKRTLENGGALSGMVVANNDLNHDSKEQLKKEFVENYTGAKNAGRPLFATGDIKWKEIGQSSRELEFSQGMIAVAIQIATAYGVPAQLVNIQEASTFNNVNEARLDVWEGTILPTADNIVDELNHWLVSMYPEEGIELCYDKDKISPLEIRRQEKVKALIKLKGVLTTAEIRQQLGYTNIEDEPVLEDEEEEEQTSEPDPELEQETIEDEPVIEESEPEAKQETNTTTNIVRFIKDDTQTPVQELKLSKQTTKNIIEEQLSDEIQLQEDIEQFLNNVQESKYFNSDKKNRDFEFKALDIEFDSLTETGEFVGYGAVFSNLDSHNDILSQGAFKRTLASLSQSDRQIPVYFNHDSSDQIGVYTELHEDDYGLFVRGKLDLSNPKAQQVYTMMRNAQITGLSIGYVTIQGQRDQNTGVRVLRELLLREISVVNLPSNVLSRIVEVKASKPNES